MIWTTVFERPSILVRWWFGMVWTRWSSIFPKHPFRQVAVILFILFFKSSWCKIASAARYLINSTPQAAAKKFAFSSVWLLRPESHPVKSLKVIDFPRFNMKCSGEIVILRGIVHVVSRFPVHFILYRGNLDCFSNSVARIWAGQKSEGSLNHGKYGSCQPFRKMS